MRRILLVWVRSPTTALPLRSAICTGAVRRYCASAALLSGADSKRTSAVNEETFTLNEDVVREHQRIAARWKEVDEELQAHRVANHSDGILAAVERGLALLEEVGPMDSPLQCRTNLLMEAAQAHYNKNNPAAARRCLQDARSHLTQEKHCDAAKVAEIDEFVGHVLLLEKKPKDSEQVFRTVLRWIDQDAKKAMPMVAVAAQNQRRTVLTGLGQAVKAQAEEAERGGDHTALALYGSALDILVDALNLHIEANDVALVKESLRAVLQCFLGVKDPQQAVTTCAKYVSWCTRHNDTAGAQEGEALLDAICTEHKIPNPNRPKPETSTA